MCAYRWNKIRNHFTLNNNFEIVFKDLNLKSLNIPLDNNSINLDEIIKNNIKSSKKKNKKICLSTRSSLKKKASNNINNLNLGQNDSSKSKIDSTSEPTFKFFNIKTDELKDINEEKSMIDSSNNKGSISKASTQDFKCFEENNNLSLFTKPSGPNQDNLFMFPKLSGPNQDTNLNISKKSTSAHQKEFQQAFNRTFINSSFKKSCIEENINFQMKSNDYNEGNFINSDFGKNHIDLALKKIERLLTEESNLEYKKASLTNIFSEINKIDKNLFNSFDNNNLVFLQAKILESLIFLSNYSINK